MNIKLAFAALCLAMPSIAAAETLTTDQTVALVATGIGDEAVVAKIKASNSTFDLSTDQMIALKNKGVSGPVIAAMIGSTAKPTMSVDSADPMVQHPSGVYIADGAKMVRMDATMSNQAKTGGILGYALTSGIASMSIKASIQNATAKVKAPSGSPTFYFFFA
jgi:hypothetical protein